MSQDVTRSRNHKITKLHRCHRITRSQNCTWSNVIVGTTMTLSNHKFRSLMVISPTLSMHQIDCNVIVNVSRLQRWPQQLQIHLAPNWSISAQNIRKCGDCDAARARQHSPILLYSALLRYSVLCFNSILCPSRFRQNFRSQLAQRDGLKARLETSSVARSGQASRLRDLEGFKAMETEAKQYDKEGILFLVLKTW